MGLTKEQLKLKKLVETEAEKFIGNAQLSIQKKLEGATLSLLGLEVDRWGNKPQFKMDHCNGRNSVLIDAFRKYAATEAEKIAKSYKPTKEDIAGFAAAFEREFKSQFTYAIRDLAKQRAQAEAAKVLDNLNINVNDYLKEVEI